MFLITEVDLRDVNSIGAKGFSLAKTAVTLSTPRGDYWELFVGLNQPSNRCETTNGFLIAI